MLALMYEQAIAIGIAVKVRQARAILVCLGIDMVIFLVDLLKYV